MKAIMPLIVAMVMLATARVNAEPPTPEKIKTYLAECERLKKEAIIDCQSRIDGRAEKIARIKANARRIRVPADKLKQRLAELDTQVQSAKKSLEDLKSGTFQPRPAISPALKLHEIGSIKYSLVDVVQVVDERQMLIRLTVRMNYTNNVNHPEKLEKFIMLRGVSSEGIADDTTIDLDDNGKVYEVSGTHTY